MVDNKQIHIKHKPVGLQLELTTSLGEMLYSTIQDVQYADHTPIV